MGLQLQDILDQVEATLDAGDSNTALELCDLALQTYPNHPLALFALGISLQSCGRREEAIDAYRSVVGRASCLQNSSFLAEAWCHIAFISLECHDIVSALHAIQRAIRINTENPDAWWIRSLIREYNGDLNGAERAREQASFLDPESYPPLPIVDKETILSLLDCAQQKLPAHLQDFLSQIDIQMVESPTIDKKPQPPLILPLCQLSIVSMNSGPVLLLFRQNLRCALHSPQIIDELCESLRQQLSRYLLCLAEG